jgi:hypothetical protein
MEMSVRKHRKIRGRSLFLFATSFALAVACLWFFSYKTDADLSNGANARIVVRYAHGLIQDGATANIYFQPKDGPSNIVALWQDSYHHPIIAIPSSNASVLLCLYENDVDLRLVRIDSGKAFKPFAPKSTLNNIVLTSSCDVELGTIKDWEEALNYLKKLTPGEFKHQSVPTVRFGILRLHSVRDWIVNRIETRTSIAPEQ